MNIPENLKYTKDHEWARIEGSIVVVGITDYAQGELGDIVYIELPAVGTRVSASQGFGTIEAVKAVSDLFAPVSGEVVEINSKLENAPEIVNDDPYGEGWMIKIKISDPKEVDTLLSEADYKGLF
ncbi:MAG: glycine cleavage system protein GcvH [Calditrichaceae bacterium]|nr:glycine cleavage system protein GcvH [Calditrichia bacterium]NUQ43522.1 glycine cleavage system protein GcvH [Calditrichaceae bacterium]